ncbi:uncharacterized protein LOC144158704 isoform X3 [Haemaphysalis longicornis]
MPLETSWMPMACVMAVSSDSGHIHHVSYHSQETQATITTSAIGTQSLPMFFSTSCQTEEEFSVLETENAQAGASEKFPAAQDGADIVAEAHLHACSQLHSGSTGSFSTISEKVLGKRKLCFCPSSQQCYHQSTHGKVYAKDTYNGEIGVSCGVTFVGADSGVPEMSTDAACSQQTQTAIATGTRGTQCALTLLISTTSQTEQEFPGVFPQTVRKSNLEGSYIPACPVKKATTGPHNGKSPPFRNPTVAQFAKNLTGRNAAWTCI